MKVDLSHIAQGEIATAEYEVQLEMTSFQSRMGDFPILCSEPMTLHVAAEEAGKLTISTKVSMETEIPCDRCMEAVRTPIHFFVDKVLSVSEDGAVDEEMEETDYLTGFELDVDKMIYAEILVNWPVKVLCKSDCKGICKVCGKNLNLGTCSCRQTEPDPRMAAIQDVFDKFKEV